MNILDFKSRFNVFKNAIIKEIIEEFSVGDNEWLKEYIIQKINSQKIIFDSSPDEDYSFIKNQGNYKKDYIKYMNTQKKYNDEMLLKLKSIISNFFNIEYYNMSQEEINNVLNLFNSENLIESYSSESIKLLSDDKVPICIKNSIISDQNMFKQKLNTFGIQFVGDNYDVDSFLEIRELLRQKYIIKTYKKNPVYLKKISNSLGIKRSRMDDAVICNIILNGGVAHQGKIASFDSFGYTNNVKEYIYLPIAYNLNHGKNYIDLAIIHELLHSLHSNDPDYTSINEIIVHKTAIEITKRLHEKGIFIFDNPEDYIVEGDSTYELLFPMIEYLYKEYNIYFKKAIISGNYLELKDYFGDSWNDYLDEINRYFYYISTNKVKAKEELFDCNDLKNIQNTINLIDNFFREKKQVQGKRLLKEKE